MTQYTDRPWWNVDDAARLLRVNRKTLYDAIASGDFPCSKVSARTYRIPAEALRLTVHPKTKSRNYHLPNEELGYHGDQLELPLDVSCLIPVRRFRNTREIISAWHYERGLYAQKARRVPAKASEACEVALYSPVDIPLEDSPT